MVSYSLVLNQRHRRHLQPEGICSWGGGFAAGGNLQLGAIAAGGTMFQRVHFIITADCARLLIEETLQRILKFGGLVAVGYGWAVNGNGVLLILLIFTF